ncbi:MAG: DUF4288 domain-containing protein [Ktedonobacterales bacterium]
MEQYETGSTASDEALRQVAAYLSGFGLMGEQAWMELRGRNLRAHVSLYPADLTFLYALTPEQRREAVAAWLADMFKRISDAVPLQDVSLSKFGLPYQLFECSVPASAFLWLLDLRTTLPGEFHIRPLALEEVENAGQAAETTQIAGTTEGAQERTPRKRERTKREWFAVHARFAIQVESDTEGMQTYEDRIILLKATSFEDTGRRFHTSPEVVNYNWPYLNSDYQLVRWQFERILDIYETSISHDGFTPTGVEVYSTLRRRHLRREYVWHGGDLTGDDG